MTMQQILRINDRIALLAAESIHTPVRDYLDTHSAAILQASAAQAAESSQGGKRLRALLTLDIVDALTEQTATDIHNVALDVACAIELFQTAALVHDDIIDEAILRRGKPAAHQALTQLTKSRQEGNGLGIMIGDILATASIQTVQSASKKLPANSDIVQTFLTMQQEVEIGQILDIAAEKSSLNNPDELAKTAQTVYRFKTASYTTIAPIELALLISGIEANLAHAIAHAIGIPLGIAFQICDDLLDIISTTHTTGKPIGGDIREGKRTVIVADTLQSASHKERVTIQRWYETQTQAEHVSHIISVMQQSGALDASAQRVRILWEESQQALQNAKQKLNLSDDATARIAHACERFVPEAYRSAR